ncbi:MULTISPECIES: transposase [Hyphomicrobiales]|uniref:transposase n=1 Tax=Methylobacterium sp. CCH7-A2 TaxID=1768789 RepID=UPI000835104E|nr:MULTISPECIES: transposase [Hyphomicrobiales]
MAELDKPVRRFEVFVSESFEPGARVGAFARSHALSPQQLFTWRREIRKAAEAMPASCRRWRHPNQHSHRSGRVALRSEPPFQPMSITHDAPKIGA